MASSRQQREREWLRLQRERQRYAAQQQREAERQMREAARAQAQAEREQRALYAAERQAEADENTQATERRFQELGDILRNGLTRKKTLDFHALRRAFSPSAFSPGALGVAQPEPQWFQFAPPEHGFLSRLFSSESSRIQEQQEARMRYEQALAMHRQQEAHRCAELEKARQRHIQQESERKSHVDSHNAHIDALERAFRAEEPEAIERCLTMAVEAAVLPEGVPEEVEVGYRKDSRQVLVLRELPDTDIVPTESNFRYVKSRDTIEPSKRKPAEVKKCYADLLAQLALLTLRDVFVATTAKQVTEVTVNCHLKTTDRATGKEVHPCLLTVGATRENFDDLVLDKLDPQDCLKHLNALMSPHPYDVEPIKPLFDPDLSRFRLTDAQDAAAGLDSRTVLTEMHPTEFEHFVRELFEAMGMQSWVTQASRDDGVDAIAVNRDPIMGGLSVIQAKRYKNVVPADAVRSLWGVMEDKKAATGVLVTTSYFGKTTHDFARRNERVRLIEGPELKQLVAEHLGLDVIPGSKKKPGS